MKPARGGLRSKSNARETTGVLAHAKSISTVRRTTEIGLLLLRFLRQCTAFVANSRVRRRSSFRGFAEITVVFLSTKLTLKEDRLVKQIICHSNKPVILTLIRRKFGGIIAARHRS